MIRPALGAVEAGSYRFVVELKSPLPPPVGGKKSQPIHRERTFTVEPSSATVWADPHGTIDVLRYIASDQENDEMNSLRTPEQQKEFWEDFWKRRDPSPGTPENERMDEFYKRVQYANQHFGTGAAIGWKTDMGRIYIVNGQPDEVVRNPFNVDRPPEEIWYYYRERKTFVFVDRDGFGRYELDNARSKQP
jgi:GWxTD domain-containing protein